MSTIETASEAEMIGSFLGKDRRARWAMVFANAKGRRKFLDGLYHEKDIAPECVTPIPHLERFPNNVYEKLKGLGAPDTCHIISARTAIDGKDLPLKEALKLAYDFGPGTIVCCIPGKLAYYLSEERNGQYLLRA